MVLTTVDTIVNQIVAHNIVKPLDTSFRNKLNSIVSSIYDDAKNYQQTYRARQAYGLVLFSESEINANRVKDELNENGKAILCYETCGLILNDQIILKQIKRGFFKSLLKDKSAKEFFEDIQGSDIGNFLLLSQSINPFSLIGYFHVFEEKSDSLNWSSKSKIFLATGIIVPEKKKELLLELEGNYFSEIYGQPNMTEMLQRLPTS